MTDATNENVSWIKKTNKAIILIYNLIKIVPFVSVLAVVTYKNNKIQQKYRCLFEASRTLENVKRPYVWKP